MRSGAADRPSLTAKGELALLETGIAGVITRHLATRQGLSEHRVWDHGCALS